MAGRNRMPRYPMVNGPHGFRQGPPPPLPRAHGPMPLHPIEEDLAMQHDEIRRLLATNRLLIDENVAIKREISAAKEELHILSQAIPKVRADKEHEARKLIQDGLKLEAKLRALEPLKAEVLQLQSEAQKLESLKQEMAAKVQNLSQDLKHLQSENQQLPTLKAEIDGLREELIRARTAYEYEKKANAELMEQRQVMEKNLVSMARELEKLRTELEKRARGPGAGAYGIMNGSPDMSYPGVFGDRYGTEKGRYGTGPWASYEHHGLPRH